LPDIEDKLMVKHEVTTDEAEELFFNWPHFRFVESGNRAGEDVYSASGQTNAGRYLIVFFISLADHWDETHEVKFVVRAKRRHRVTVDPQLYDLVEAEARERGLQPETLINLWISERLQATA
jgi:hypothetical protein